MNSQLTRTSVFNRENILFCFFLLLITLLLISSFIVPGGVIINPYVTGPKLWLYLLTGILLFGIGFYLLLTRNLKLIRLNSADALVGIILFYILLRQLAEGKDIFFTDKLVNYIYLSILYFSLKIYIASLHLKKLKAFISTLTVFIIIITCISSIFGLLQLYEIITPKSYFFKVTGQFKSPAPYANYLIALLPFSIASYFLYPSKSKGYILIKYGSLLALLAGLLVLPVTYTRAAWIGIILGTSFILFYKYKVFELFKNRNGTFWIITLISLIVGFILLFGLYQLKPKSADGRLLVWKVSTEIIKQHPLIGIGYGNFEGQYNSYQAAYFARGDSSPQEIELADKVFYSYNVFIQILAEQGIIGFVLFAALLFSLFRLVFNDSRNSYSNYLIVGSAAAILSIISCGQFSYPFDILSVFIIFFISMALLSGLSTTKTLQKKEKRPATPSINYIFKLSGTLFLAGSFFVFYHTYEKYNAYSSWKLYTSENQTSDKYSKIYPVLKKDANFRAKYGKHLLDEKKYEEAIQVLEDACYYMSDPFIYIHLAQAYIALKDHEKAENAFIFAANMIPNRLYSNYLLAKFYFDTEQRKKAKMLSDIILATQPKIMSPAIEEMKADIRELMSAGQ